MNSMMNTAATTTTTTDAQCEPRSPASAAEYSSSNNNDGSTRCDGCKSCGAILELDGCGHRFHPRCVFAWPLTQCEVCAAPVRAVKIFREFRNAPNSMARKGKWSADEHKYANMMMKQFQLGALPLVDGLHLRGFIASLLQCDPLRVTKKYSGHAIGKQNFFYQYRKTYCYNLHIKLQKRVSSLRNHFYWHIQYRCKFGHALNIQELKAAESDYWVREFLRFADKIGQAVEFAAHPMPASPAPRPASQSQSDEAQSRNQQEQQQQEQEAPREVESAAAFSPPPSTPVAQTASNASVVVVDSPTAPSANKSSRVSPGSSRDLADGGALSPLSFDEWSDATPVFGAVLDGMVFEDFSQGDSAPPASELPSKVPAARCSLGEWLQEEEARWNETMAVPSWSFTLSDCA